MTNSSAGFCAFNRFRFAAFPQGCGKEQGAVGFRAEMWENEILHQSEMLRSLREDAAMKTVNEDASQQAFRCSVSLVSSL